MSDMDIVKILGTYLSGNYSGPPLATDEVMAIAASEIKMLRAKIRTLENDVRQTHYAGCWRDPKHHACAVRYIEELEKDKARLDALESVYLSGCAVISDDNGYFAVAGLGTQNVRLDNSGPLEAVFWVEEDEFFDNVRDAIDAAMKEE